MAVKKAPVKKQWIPILANAYFTEPIGETLAENPQAAVGRTATMSLAALTGASPRQSVVLTFLLTSADDAAVSAELVSYQILASSVKKLTRRNRSKIEDSFLCKTADGRTVRIKPLLVARSKLVQSTRAALQRNARAYLTRAIAKLSYDQLMMEIMQNKLQGGMRKALHKLSALQSSEIRWAMLDPINQAVQPAPGPAPAQPAPAPAAPSAPAPAAPAPTPPPAPKPEAPAAKPKPAPKPEATKEAKPVAATA